MKRTLYLLSFLTVILTGCTKETTVTPGEEDRIDLRAEFTVEGQSMTDYVNSRNGNQSDTRGIAMNAKAGAGVWVMKPGSLTVPYLPNYDNLYYGYYNNSSSLTFMTRPYAWMGEVYYDYLPIYKTKGNYDLYAYFPHKADVTDLTRVPFDVTWSDTDSWDYYNQGRSEMNDYLYMTPVLNVVPTPNQTITGTFKHVMTALTIELKTKTGTALGHSLRHITIETEDGQPWIPLKGTYNALTGQVTTTEYGSSLTDYVFDGMTGSSYNTFILPEIATTSGATNRVLKIRLFFNYEKHSGKPFYEWTESYSGPITLDLATVKLADGVTYGLRTKYRYTLKVTMDSIYFLDIPELNVVPWTSEVKEIDV